MAAGLNRVSLIGNLGKDPELRQSQSGTAVSNFSMGVTERRKEGENYKDHTEWVNVVCFGKTAENASKYLQKGRQVFVEGRLQTKKWEDKAGQTRYTTEVVAGQVIFLGTGGAKEQSGSPAFANKNDIEFGGSSSGAHTESSSGFIEDDEIPF